MDAERRFTSVRESEQAGIAVIYQELSLVKDLSVAENIFLGREPRRFGIINWEELYSRAQKLLDDLHLAIDPRTRVGNLGIGQQQLVEIAKALSQDARILVLDEPTAALTDAEVETLFGILNKLARARRRDDLHLAQARRSFSHQRSHYGAARRPDDRHECHDAIWTSRA